MKRVQRRGVGGAAQSRAGERRAVSAPPPRCGTSPRAKRAPSRSAPARLPQPRAPCGARHRGPGRRPGRTAPSGASRSQEQQGRPVRNRRRSPPPRRPGGAPARALRWRWRRRRRLGWPRGAPRQGRRWQPRGQPARRARHVKCYSSLPVLSSRGVRKCAELEVCSVPK